MKKSLLLGLAVLFGAVVYAQEQNLLNLRLEARGDYQREYFDGSAVDDNCGFKGKFLNLRADGEIGGGFSYSLRQRLNKEHSDASFFDATDWVYLAYKTGDWEFSAGKQVVAIGGFEYDAAPIDLYFCSEWWNNIPCYRLGGTVAYTFAGDSHSDKFSFQICESPFRGDITLADGSVHKQEEMFAYNLMWASSHGWFSSLYSVNFVEYLPGKFVNYISLGNRFHMGRVTVDLDLMNRAASGQAFLGKDFSVIGKVAWAPTEKLNLFAKASYDVNNTSTNKDYLVSADTEITRVGAGVEFFPLKDARNDVRIHAAGSYSFGDNTNPAGVLLDSYTYLSVGVTWRMNLLSFKQ